MPWPNNGDKQQTRKKELMESEMKEILSTKLPDITKEKLFQITLDFGVALEAMKNGKKVWRDGWATKGIYVALFKVPLEDGKKFLTIPGLFDAESKIIDYWHPGPADLLAEDWRFA
jgi:hypothetical protein